MRPNSATVMPVRAQEHEERFHEQGEAALGPGPWHLDLLDAATLAAIDAGHKGVHVALELEEVEVPPGALEGVVDGAGLAGVRMGKAAAGREIQINVQTARLGVEADVSDAPRSAFQTEGQTKDLSFVHAPECARPKPVGKPREETSAKEVGVGAGEPGLRPAARPHAFIGKPEILCDFSS